MISSTPPLPLALLIFFRFAASTCYYPDGSTVLDDVHQPCNQVANTTSMCCATSQLPYNDKCLSNGLCWNACEKRDLCGDLYHGHFMRQACTDPSWDSPFCLKNICTDPTDGGVSDGGVSMMQCWMDGSWCCGKNITSNDCCLSKSKNRVFLAETIGISGSAVGKFETIVSTLNVKSSVTSTPAPDSSASTSTSTSTSASASASSDSVKKQSTGLGLGIGIGVGFAVVFALVIFCLRRWRRGPVPDNKLEKDGEAYGRSCVNDNIELEDESNRIRIHHEISA